MFDGALRKHSVHPHLYVSPRKLTGIAPVFDPSYPLEGFRILDAKTLGTQPLGPQVQKPSWSAFFENFLKKEWVQHFFNNWIAQDFWFVMNKLSIFGLMMGMMLLGAMFFGVGFLTAYTSLSPTVLQQEHPWHQANGTQNVGGVQSGVAHFGGEVVERYAQNASLHGANIALGVVGRMQSKVPGALQPFAKHASAIASNHVVGTAFDASRLAKENTQKILSHPGSAMTSVHGNMQYGPQQPVQIQNQGQMYAQPSSQPQYVYPQPGQQAYTPPAQSQYPPQQGVYTPSPQQYYGQPFEGYAQPPQYANPTQPYVYQGEGQPYNPHPSSARSPSAKKYTYSTQR